MEFTTQEILVLSGAVVVVIAAIWWKFGKDIRLAIKPTLAEGTIINWTSTITEGKRFFYPLIEFYDSKGVRHAFRAEERCEGQPMYEQGTKVTIKYLESDPEVRKTEYPRK
jgi:hypothetical protein